MFDKIFLFFNGMPFVHIRYFLHQQKYKMSTDAKLWIKMVPQIVNIDQNWILTKFLIVNFNYFTNKHGILDTKKISDFYLVFEIVFSQIFISS